MLLVVVAQPLHQLLARHRPANMIALGEMTTGLCQHYQALLVLNTLGGTTQFQGIGKRYQRCGNCLSANTLGEVFSANI